VSLRLTISHKVFLVFMTLTSLTVLLGCTVYFGLHDLRVAGREVQVITDFQFEIKELSSFQVGKKDLFLSPDQAYFREEFAKADQLLRRMKNFQTSLTPETERQIEAMASYLEYYRQAFVELFVKYEQDHVLNQQQRKLAADFSMAVKGLPPDEQLAVYENFLRMQALFEEAYHQRDAVKMGEMKEVGRKIAAITDHAGIRKLFNDYETNAEAIYLNFLGIIDREDFLTDTANHFFQFAMDTAVVITAQSRQRQMLLSWFIGGFSLFAISLTLLLWWQASLYFRRFLKSQKKAISAIEASDYDYDVPMDIPNDEIGDLTVFMKELAVDLKINLAKVRESEKQLRLAKEEWERTFDAIGDIVTLQDADMHMTRANKAAYQAFDCKPGELIGKHCYEVFRGAFNVCSGCPIPETRKDFKAYSAEIEHPRLNKTFWVSASPVIDESGELRGIVHFAKDITAIKKLEAQFLQAQKMEAIGRLSSGVAHDFNNILTSILGYSELLLLKDPGDPNWREEVEVIKQAGEKAAVLVRQLLTFSRRHPLDVQNVNVNEIIHSLHKMLSRIIREDVLLKLQLAEQISTIKADPAQIEQIIMNLTVNARDAMSGGGSLAITTENMMIDNHYARMHVGMQAGPYVMIAVSDNGHGMTREIQERIFEPFFTTKQAGTGLGLATVYSIVKQHGGAINVYSEISRGTTFKIYFPAIQEEAKVLDRLQPAEKARHGSETILVVDDEASIRQMIVDSLSTHGYRLIGAANGEEALQAAEKFSGNIDLLLTDIIMPGMYGTELAARLLQKRPDMKVLFMSGYLEIREQENDLIDMGKNFMGKPIMPSNLMKKLREILD